MSESNHPNTLHPTRIDIPLEIRVYIVGILNRTLASTIDLRSQIKQASWNVKGAEYLQLQTFFTSIATELDAYSDLLGQRIAALGGVAKGTVRMAAMQSTLQEYPGDLMEGAAHVQVLAERCAHYATAIRADLANTTDVEDGNTASIYADISRGIENRLRVFDAHLYH